MKMFVAATTLLLLHPVVAQRSSTAAATTTAAAPDQRSQYPLLHIGDKMNCSATGPCTKDSGADGNGRSFRYALRAADSRALGAFSLIHTSPQNAAQVEKFSNNHAVPIVMYTESVPICGGNPGVAVPYVTRCNDTVNFETGGFRRDAMVYLAGNLTKPLSAAGTELELCLGVPYCCGKYAAPLVASTANGSYSDYSGSGYVTFVRIGDELMKIVAARTKPNPDPEVDGKCQRLTVERGLDGSTPRPAAAGAVVLAPAYAKSNGSPLFTKSGKILYQADYDSFYAWSSLANFTVAAVQQVHKGPAVNSSSSPCCSSLQYSDTAGLRRRMVRLLQSS